jgi:hypothetical protein
MAVLYGGYRTPKLQNRPFNTCSCFMRNKSPEPKCLVLKCACLDYVLAQEEYADKKHLRNFGFSMWRLFDCMQYLL